MTVLRVRVVIGDDREVRGFSGDAAHARAPVLLSLADRAEDGDQAAAGTRPKQGEHTTEGVRGVGEVDYDGKGLALVDELHASRRSRPRTDAACDSVQVETSRQARAGCGEGVVHVEGAGLRHG